MWDGKKKLATPEKGVPGELSRNAEKLLKFTFQSSHYMEKRTDNITLKTTTTIVTESRLGVFGGINGQAVRLLNVLYVRLV